MICDEHKTVFIHIPRNAGSSIKQALNHTDNTHSQHQTIEEVNKEHGPNIQSYYKWTIVRNPWSRELSLYHYALEKKLVNSVSFEEYLQLIKNQTTKNLILEKNQIEYFTIEDYVEVDQIVRLEYISGTWQKVCEQLNVEPIALSRKNQSVNTKNHYTQKCIDLVSEIRKQDIEFLNYDCPY